MCFVCSQSNGFETDISTIIGINKKSTLSVNNDKQNFLNQKQNTFHPLNTNSTSPLKSIDTKYLIMGFSDGVDQIEMRKKFAGAERQIKIYISTGGEELKDIQLGEFENKKYYSLKPEDWQQLYMLNSLNKVNEFYNVNLKVVRSKDEADFSIAICPLPDNNFLSAGPEKGQGENWIYISHQAGLFTTEIDLDLIIHDDFSKKMQKATFIHELGHLLGLEHPFDEHDGDVINPYYPDNFSYLRDASFPYESTLMGWNGSYVDDTNFENIWFQEIDTKSLEVIWGKSNVKAFSDNSYEYKFYNLGNNQYGIKSKNETAIDPLTGVNVLKFNDQNLNLVNYIQATFDQVTGLNTYSGRMFRLYNAAFKRLPDPDGLRYWINNLSSGANDDKIISQSFLISTEFSERYGSNVSNEKYIETLYLNVLGRTYDQEGYDYWVGKLNNGRERYQLLLDFAESAENKTLFTEMTGVT